MKPDYAKIIDEMLSGPEYAIQDTLSVGLGDPPTLVRKEAIGILIIACLLMAACHPSCGMCGHWEKLDEARKGSSKRNAL